TYPFETPLEVLLGGDMTRATVFALFSLLFSTLTFSQASWPAKPLLRDEPLDVQDFSEFGAATALSGSHAMVGAPLVDGHGVVYVFEHQGTKWVQTQRLVARDAAPGNFGSGIVLQDNTALISDTGRNLVYSFEWSNGAFRQTAVLRGGVELFGSALALEGCVA